MTFEEIFAELNMEIIEGKLEDVFCKMREVMRDKVENYHTDGMIDVATICKDYYTDKLVPYHWSVGENGTHLVRIDIEDIEFAKARMEAIKVNYPDNKWYAVFITE